LGTLLATLTIGHLILIVRVAIPITRVLEFLQLLKSFRHRQKDRSLYTDSYFLRPLFIILLLLICVLALFYFLLSSFFVFLLIGFGVGLLKIFVNFFLGRYSVNRSSFQNWYLNDHGKDLDIHKLEMMQLDDKDKLFDCVDSWIGKVPE
jgi:hypothetical protein